MLPSTWKPEPVGGLIRVGPNSDGGYVLSRRVLAVSRMLVSMGLNDDWRFEEAFSKATDVPVICFDGTVDHMFWRMYAAKMAAHLRPWRALHYLSYRRFFAKKGNEHRQNMIGYDRPGTISLTTIFGDIRESDIFLKVDIEGSEYRILDQIAEHRTRMTGVVMEFHDVDLHADRITRFIEAMQGFTIVWLVANNYGGTDPDGDPTVLEISLMREDLVDNPTVSSDAMLGIPNNPHAAGIPLHFAAV